MRIWIKLLVGLVLGSILAFLLPATEAMAARFATVSEVCTQIGRYAVFPLVFFSLVLGTYTLRLERQLLRVYRLSLMHLAAGTVLLTLVGLGSVLLFSPRIPIITVSVEAPVVSGFTEVVKSVFPANLFAALAGSGGLLLPVVVLAVLLGANLTFDRVITRPVVQLSDSLSRVFYHFNSLVVELFWVAVIPITAALILQIRLIENLDIYKELLLIIGIDCLFVVFAIYPVLLYILDRESNPFKLLYAAIAPAVTGLVTGNEHVAMGVLIKHGKENFGVPRTVGSAVFPLFALFGRAGTAMISGISFYLILNSLLPSADIDVAKILFVAAFSILVSFALGSVPGLGAYVSITLLSRLFDRFWPTFGLLEHYKILEPVKLVLVCFAVLLDVLTAWLACYLVGRTGGWLAVKESRDFV